MTDFPQDGILRPHATEPGRADAWLTSPCVQNHAANLIELHSGDIACVWFGGTQEGIPDISPYFARLPKGSDTWSAPVRLSDDMSRSEQNPILTYGPDGKLWLIFTAQISGNQETALVRCRTSDDEGQSWSPVRTLIDEPGTFVRQPPLLRANGDWLLPVFLCRTNPGTKWTGEQDISEVRISRDGGQSWSRHPVPESTGCVHMSIVAGEQGLTALFRSRWADNVYLSRSTDGGQHWSVPVATSLPNNNSSIQALRLRSGALALIHNYSSMLDATERRLSLYDDLEDDGSGDVAAPVEGRSAFWGAPRAPMTLSVSHDDGQSWTQRRDLEVGDGYCLTNNSREQLNRELSYPSIIEASDGRIHVAFTYFRQAIKHVRLDGVTA